MSVQNHQLLFPLPAASPAPSIPLALEEVGIDGVQHVLHLLWIGQVMCRQTTGAVERLCQEVKKITQEKAQLVLRRQEKHVKRRPLLSNVSMNVPVQFGDIMYGTLCVAPDCDQPEVPALPPSIAQLLAQTCSWLLYTFEQSIFLQRQCQHLNDQMYGSLTKREREVLTLMYLGCDQKTIAEKLCISPATVRKHRQHIYEQLGVHNERDALLAAYQFGLVSILELVSANQ